MSRGALLAGCVLAGGMCWSACGQVALPVEPYGDTTSFSTAKPAWADETRGDSAGPPTATCWLDEIPLVSGWVEDLAVLDLNGDAVPDVLYRDLLNGVYGAALGDGDGGFVHIQDAGITVPVGSFEVLQAKDLDGDGDDDLLLQQSVWFNTTPAGTAVGPDAILSFAESPVSLPVNHHVDRVWAAEDLDGDGISELLILDGDSYQSESQGRGTTACVWNFYKLSAFLCRPVPGPAGEVPSYESLANRLILDSREEAYDQPGCGGTIGLMFALTGEYGQVPEQTAPNSMLVENTAFITLQFPGRLAGSNDRGVWLARVPVTIGGFGNFDTLLWPSATRFASHAAGDFLGTGSAQVYTRGEHPETFEHSWSLFDLQSGSLIDSTSDVSPQPTPPVDWNLDGLPDLLNTINDGSPGFPLGGGGIFLGTDTVAWADFNGDGYPDRLERRLDVGEESHVVTLSGPTPDYNSDGVGDACQPTPDENGNGVNDWEEIWLGDAADCNGNFRIDSAEIAVLDELDCNQNGLPDSCELADLPALDADGDGILDDCVPRWTPVPLSITLDGWVRTNIGTPTHWTPRAIGANGWCVVTVHIFDGTNTNPVWIRHNLITGEVDQLLGASVSTTAMPLINGLGEVVYQRRDNVMDGQRRLVFFWLTGQSDATVTLDITEPSSSGTNTQTRSLLDNGWFIATWNYQEAPRLINARTGETRFLDHFEDFDVVENTGGMDLHRISKDGRIFGSRWRTGSGAPGCVHSWADPFAPIEEVNCSAWQCKPYSAISSGTGITALWTGQAYGPCNNWRAIGNRIYDEFGNEYGSRVIDNRASTTSRADFMIDQILDGGQIIASPSTSDGEKIVVVWPTLSSETYFDARDLLTGDTHGVSGLGSNDLDTNNGYDFSPMISYDGSFVLNQPGEGVIHQISYPAPPGLDLTADGLADDDDLLALVAFLEGGPAPAGDADLNHDGVVDPLDAEALAWWLIASRADTLPDCNSNGVPDLAELARFGGMLPDADNDLVPDGCVPAGCNVADFAEPFGLLDLADVLAFGTAFTAADPVADLDPNGLFDLADVLVFINAFNAGCP